MTSVSGVQLSVDSHGSLRYFLAVQSIQTEIKMSI